MARPKINIPEASKLAFLPTEKIHANPNNPRLIFDEDELFALEQSIRHTGKILVPLLVYQRAKDGAYVVLDGERRLRAAREIGLPKVPANIIEEPNILQNLLTMFNIHNTRVDWDAMPTALKLEVIMREARTKDERELAALTGMTKANVHRCLTLLDFDKKYQDMMLAPKEERIKADYFVEMHRILGKVEREYKDIAKKYPRKKLTDVFVQKIQDKVITTPIEFRSLWKVLNVKRKGVPREIAQDAFLTLLQEPKGTIETAYSMVAAETYGIETAKRLARDLLRELKELRPKAVAQDKDALEIFRDLDEEIHEILGG